MRRRSRLLRVAKWGGVVVCMLSVAGYVWSGWRGWDWGGPGGYIAIRHGMLRLEHHGYPLPYPEGRRGWEVSRYSQPWQFWNRRYALLPSVISLDDTIGMNGKLFRRSVTAVLIPFWVPFVLAASLTAFLWWRDRRPPLPGHCPCGYDLTGNESGTCPECGRGIA